MPSDAHLGSGVLPLQLALHLPMQLGKALQAPDALQEGDGAGSQVHVTHEALNAQGPALPASSQGVKRRDRHTRCGLLGACRAQSSVGPNWLCLGTARSLASSWLPGGPAVCHMGLWPSGTTAAQSVDKSTVKLKLAVSQQPV